MTEWRSTNETPGWRDFGAAEFMREDGSIVAGRITLEDFHDTPVPSVTMADGTAGDFWSFAKWRRISE